MKAAYNMRDDWESQHDFCVMLPVSDHSYAFDYMTWTIFNRLMPVIKEECLKQVNVFISVLFHDMAPSTLNRKHHILSSRKLTSVCRCWWVRVNKNMNSSLIRETGLEDLWSMLRFETASPRYYCQVCLAVKRQVKLICRNREFFFFLSWVLILTTLWT